MLTWWCKNNIVTWISFTGSIQCEVAENNTKIKICTRGSESETGFLDEKPWEEKCEIIPVLEVPYVVGKWPFLFSAANLLSPGVLSAALASLETWS